MNFQTTMSIDLAEMAFRAVQSSITATDTGAALQAGEPVLMATHTLSHNGHFVQRAVTSTDAVNNLVVGCVHQAIPHEGLGLAQVYGIDTDVRLLEAITAAPGQLLIPQLNATATQVSGRSCFTTQVSPQFAVDPVGAVTDQFRAHGAAGLAVVLRAATAVTATAGSSTVTAFLRML